MSIKLVDPSAFQWKTWRLDGKGSSSFPRTVLSATRTVRSAHLWKSSHLRLFIGQVINRKRNERASYSDDEYLKEAVAWLERAQDATPDGGVSGGYDLGQGWRLSCLKATGSSVPTFLRLADEWGNLRFVDRAKRCVEFLLSAQLDCGAFPRDAIGASERAPSPFNSAQIIAALLAWHRHTGDERSLKAAIRAADWLVSLQESDDVVGKDNNSELTAVYSADAASCMAELGAFVKQEQYLAFCERHLDWILQHWHRETAWFDVGGENPREEKAGVTYSQTLADTISGVLQASAILRRNDGFQAARLSALAALRRTEIRGGVPGMFNKDWRTAASAACLTGNAQLALVWFRLYELEEDVRYVNAAVTALDGIKLAQPMRSTNPALRGGVPGSAPLWGPYAPLEIPSWAAKFYIDALLKKRAILNSFSERRRGVAPVQADIPITCAHNSAAITRRPTVVLYTSRNSGKPQKVLKAASEWGFVPAGVIIESSPRPPLHTRLLQRLQNDGLSTVFNSVLSKARPGRQTRSSVTLFDGELGDPYQVCRELGIPFWTVPSVNDAQAQQILSSLQPDLAVNSGAGILRTPILRIPRLGTLNAHMGRLPFYRGTNAAEWAALNGDQVGCSVHQIDPGIDTGPIISTRSVDITGAANSIEVRSRVSDAQAVLLATVLRWIHEHGCMPLTRNQALDEGRQFFRMRNELRQILDAELSVRRREPSQLDELSGNRATEAGIY